MYVLDLFYHTGCWYASAILRIATICRNNAPQPLVWQVSQRGTDRRCDERWRGAAEAWLPQFLCSTEAFSLYGPRACPSATRRHGQAGRRCAGAAKNPDVASLNRATTQSGLRSPLLFAAVP